MELTLTVTLSDRLFGLLEDKLPNLGRRVEKAITKELSAQARRESNISVDVIASQVNPAPEPAQPETPAAPVAETEKQESPAPESIPSDPPKMAEKIREIMHRTRQRLEGEDYKENTTSDGYKKYHRQLNSKFKLIAVTLGFDKPSSINTQEKLAAFIDECDALIIGEDGNITSYVPF